MPETITDGQSARAEYMQMAPDEKQFVQGVIKQKGDTPAMRLHAVNLVLSRREQTRAANVGADEHSASADLSGPTRGEQVGAGLLAAANTLSNDAVPTAKKIANAAPALVGAARDFASDNPTITAMLAPLIGGAATIGAPVILPTAAMAAKFLPEADDSAEAEAKQAAPYNFGVGQLTGDMLNAVGGLAGPASSAANALEDLSSGAKLSDVVSTGLPKLKAAAGKASPGVLGTLLKGAARKGIEKVVGSDALDAAVKALRGDVQGPQVDPDVMARESWVRDLMPDAYGAAPDEAASLVGKRAPPPIPEDAVSSVTKVDRTPPRPPSATPDLPRTKADRTPLPKVTGSSAIRDAVEAISSKPPDMPADVMAAETPKAALSAKPPKITGSGEQLTAQVKQLPPAKRLDFLRRIKADMGEDIARAVAKAAGVSLKLGL